MFMIALVIENSGEVLYIHSTSETPHPHYVGRRRAAALYTDRGEALRVWEKLERGRQGRPEWRHFLEAPTGEREFLRGEGQ